MDSNQWMTQEMNSGGMRGVAMGEMASSSGGISGERKLARPQKDKVVNCPRCNSTNTKFCYYNNYSLTQPRYFCKSCRRYWTEGGTLRNVPVGGGSRKHKRSTSLGGNPSSSPSSSSSAKLMISNIPDLNPPNMNGFGGNPSLDQGQDLNLGSYRHFELPKFNQVTSSTTSALELLRTGVLGPNSSNGFMSMSMGSDNGAMYASNNGSNSGFSFQELKPGAAAGGLSFSSSVHNLGSAGIGENGRMMMFPFGGMNNMKQVSVPSSTTITTTANNHEVDDDQNNISRGMSNQNGFWNGGGSW